MQSAHLIVIQTFLCKPKSSLLNLLHVSKQFFKYKSLYKLTKLGLNNEQQRIESIFSTTSLTEVEKLSHLIGFLYGDGQEVHLSKWENSPREHTWSDHFSLTAFFNWNTLGNSCCCWPFTISEEILTMFLIPMQSREQRDKWWRFLFLLKNDDIDSPALHTYEAADEKLWSSEIHNKQMLHHKSWHCWIIITISNIPTWKEKIGMKPLELWNAAEFQTDGFENCWKRYHTYHCEQSKQSELEVYNGIVCDLLSVFASPKKIIRSRFAHFARFASYDKFKWFFILSEVSDASFDSFWHLQILKHETLFCNKRIQLTEARFAH